MQDTARPPELVHFGIYEADLRSGELRKNGLKLKLSGQPFQVLALLLEHPGDVVTREEIQKRLWPADPFVDFDHSLNTAINKIREALGDSAENPRFVETLPRRGYRFIAPVEEGAAGLVLGQIGHLHEVPVPVLAGAVREPPLRTQWRLWLAAVLATLALGALVARLAWQHWRPKQELIERQLTTNSSELAVRASAISPDGRYLAYADDSGIYLKVIDTAETHDLPAPAGSRISKLAWFPEGDKLLASGEAGQPSVSSLWRVSILGGAPQKLRDDAADGSVSPDGASILFRSGNAKEIWQMGLAGEEARKLITASEWESLFMPVVAKGRLWYEKYSAGGVDTGSEVESRDLRGGPPTVLVSRLPDTFAFLLLPNGRFFYSWSDRPYLYQGSSIWEIRADVRTGLARGKPRQLAEWTDFEVSGLSASADAKRLTLVKQHTRLWSVYVGDLDGNGPRLVNPRRLTLSDSFDHAYAWTPDSRSILFDSNRNGTWDTFRQFLDQRTAEKLVASPAGSIRPAMSPDGVSVLYLVPPTGFAYHQPHKIMRVALTGGPPQSLGEIQSIGHIRCARTANVCVVSDSGPRQRVLYALDPVKGKGRELLRTGPGAPASDEDTDWDVSPDGSSLAFTKNETQAGAFQIQVRSLPGVPTCALNISGWGIARFMRWAADGEGWYVTTLRPQTILKVELAGKAQLLTQGFFDPVPSPDGRHAAMGARILVSNVWMLENF